VSIAAEQEVVGDFYGAATTISVSGRISDDALLFGQEVTHNGSIGTDAAIVAGSVGFFGDVGDDVRVVAGEVTIGDSVGGDVIVVAGRLTILSTATITGDVLFYGGEADIAGSVGGSVMGTMESLRIDGEVAGGVDVTVQQLTLGDRATITGTVRYVSQELLVRAQNATVVGDITRSDPLSQVESGLMIEFVLIPMLIWLFTILVWHLLARKTLAHVSAHAVSSPMRSFLIGFGFMLFGPLTVFILLVSIIGSLVGFLMLATYVLVVMAGLIGSAAVVGRYLAQLTGYVYDERPLLILAVGTVVSVALLIVPIVGAIIVLAVWMMTVGALAEFVVARVR
jgi:hypothetical protein